MFKNDWVAVFWCVQSEIAAFQSSQFKIKLGKTNRDDAKVSVDCHNRPVLNQVGQVRDTVYARDAKLPGDYRTMYQHATTGLSDRGSQRHKVGHHGLDCIAEDDFACLETPKGVGTRYASDRT